MYLLGLGLVLIALKYLEISPVVGWDWWVVLLPLAGAALWWVWADVSGYTKSKAVQRMDEKKKARQEAARERLGLGVGGRKKR
jgi:small Trp-rich protein